MKREFSAALAPRAVCAGWQCKQGWRRPPEKCDQAPIRRPEMRQTGMRRMPAGQRRTSADIAGTPPKVGKARAECGHNAARRPAECVRLLLNCKQSATNR